MTSPASAPVFDCEYCSGKRAACTCTEDCGARHSDDLDVMMTFCPKAPGFLDWLKGTGLYSNAEIESLRILGFYE